MKAIKYSIQRKLPILSNIFRLNHWRGHGIHSPFIYGMVREIVSDQHKSNENSFVPEMKISGSDISLLKSIKDYLGYTVEYSTDKSEPANRTLFVLLHGINPESLKKFYNECVENETDDICIAVMHANRTRNIFFLCKELAERQECVVLDFSKHFFFLFRSNLDSKYYRIKRNLLK